MAFSDVVRVELVGSWWDLWAPLVALAVSLVTLGWTIWVRHRDNARLEVRVTSFDILGPQPSGRKRYVATEATNVGRAGKTVINNFHLRIPGGPFMMKADSALPTVTLPAHVEPGQSVTFVWNATELAEVCVKHDITPDQLRPGAQTGHGTFKGKWKKSALEVMEDALAAVRKTSAPE